MVLVPAHAARGGLRLQGVRFAEGWPRALDCAYSVRGSDHAAARAAAREHRNPHAGVFLMAVLLNRAGRTIPLNLGHDTHSKGSPSLAGERPVKPLTSWTEDLIASALRAPR